MNEQLADNNKGGHFAKEGSNQAWTGVFPPAKPSHLSFSYSSGVLKSGSQYCLLLNMWQSRHRHSLSHFFFPLHHVWVNACSLVFFPPQFKQSAKMGSSLCFHLAAHSSTLMILNPWPMDGFISTGFPCMICDELRAVWCEVRAAWCEVRGCPSWHSGPVARRLRLTPYLFPFLGVDLDHRLGVDRGLDLRAEVGYDVLKAHSLRVMMITVRRRTQFLWLRGTRGAIIAGALIFK